MKLLVITHEFPPIQGGIAVFLHNLCIQLCNLGHEVDILTPIRTGCIEAHAGQKYQVYQYKELKFLASIVPLYHTLSMHFKKNYDLVFIGHFMTTHALGALVLHLFKKVPYVILSHGNDMNYCITFKIDSIVARLMFGHAALMLGNSHFTVNAILKNGYKGQVKLLHPGVDSDQFHPKAGSAEIRHLYNLDDHRTLLTIARLVAKKNVDGVLRALKIVMEKVPNVIYLIAGDGEEKHHLKTLCDSLGLNSSVYFLGFVENDKLPALYCASDVYVMPSYDAGGDIETFGISFLEASACGKPVIGGKSGGIVDAVIDGETGLLINPHNVDEIAETIIRLFTDRQLARKMGENGRRRIENELTWEIVGKRLNQYLQNVTKCVV